MAVCVILVGAFAMAAIAAHGRLRGRVPGLWRLQLCLWAGLAASVWCLVTGKADTHTGLIVITAGVIILGAAGAVFVATPRLAVPARLPRRVLFIGAHPDDLELACGGTVARLADSGHEIFALVLTRGGSGGSPQTREQEAKTAALLLGVTTVQVLDLPDTQLGQCERQTVQAIEAVLCRFGPDIIFTHSRNDQHADHRAVHVATLQAARSHPAILCYESPSATQAFDPRIFVDIENYLETKVAAVGVHADQQAKPYMAAERLRGAAVFRGAQGKVRMAEGFEPVRMPGMTAGELL